MRGVRRWIPWLAAAALMACGGANTGKNNNNDTTNDNNDSGGSPEGIWRPESVETSGMVSGTSSVSMIPQAKTPLAAALPDPMAGLDGEMYVQFEGKTLKNYLYYHGRPAAYRLTRSWLQSGSTIVAMAEDSGLPSSFTEPTYEMKGGRLVMNIISSAQMNGATEMVSIKVIFAKYTGAFPPAGWPAQIEEVK